MTRRLSAALLPGALAVSVLVGIPAAQARPATSAEPATRAVPAVAQRVAARSPYITNGTILTNGATRTSANGAYTLALQNDGNLVLYRNASTGRRAIWASDTRGFNAVRLVMQRDGNLVMLKGTKPIWATNSAGAGQSAYLAVQNDGNLVVYYRSAGQLKWYWGRAFERQFIWPGHFMRSGVVLDSRNRLFRLAMQRDGNLVLTRLSDRKVLWHSRTAGRPNAFGRQNRDGNFALYTSAGTAYWSTRTNKDPGAYLSVTNDGNLVIWMPGKGAIWQTGTHG